MNIPTDKRFLELIRQYGPIIVIAAASGGAMNTIIPEAPHDDTKLIERIEKLEEDLRLHKLTPA